MSGSGLRPLAVCCLAAALVLAGCGMPFGGGNSTATPGNATAVPTPTGTNTTATPAPTATPTATPTPAPTPEATATFSPTDVPGVSERGVDAGQLTDAHEQALEETNYTYTLAETPGGTFDRRWTRVRVGETRKLERERASRDGRLVVNRTVFRNESRGFRRLPDRDYQRWTAFDPLGRLDRPTGDTLVWNAFSLANYSLAGNRTVEGTPVAVLRASGPANASGDLADANVTSLDSTLLVDADGVVRRLTFNVTQVGVGGPVTSSTVLDIAAVGDTTVSRPAWLAKPATIDERTETVRNETLGASLTVTGDPRTVDSVRLFRSDFFLLDSETIEDARVSPLVEADSDRGNLTDVEATLSYNESDIPGGNESTIALFAYDDEAQTLLPLNTSVDPANDTVTGSEFAATVTTGSGTDAETYEPELNSLVERRVFVVMHVETWTDAFER